MAHAIGIDLGTSNCCVAVVLDGEPVVLMDEDGHRTQPSVVSFSRDGSTVVGHKARKQLTYAPGSTVFSAKRLIGRRFAHDEVERMRRLVGWEIVEGPQGDARIRVHDQTMAVEEISAHVLGHMKAIAEACLGETVTKAVITVPAYFNDQQRNATRDAAIIAGLDCLRILNEPTAAALAFGFGKDRHQHIAVYDLGGGTFDISVLRLDADFYEVVSTSGDTFLGGDDIDMAITDWLIELVRQEHGVDLSEGHVARMRLRAAAEEAKISLSRDGIANIDVTRLGRDEQGNQLDVHATLDLTLLKKLAWPIIQRTFQVCDDALAQAGLAVSQIDQVLLVGGMTRMPLVQETTSQYFGQPAVANLNPDEVVAIGAAIQAHNLTQGVAKKTSVLLDVTPQTLGIETVGGFMEPLIPRNSPVPTEASKMFHMANDFQTGVRVCIYQGEDRKVGQNSKLGEFKLDELPPGLRGEVSIEITFSIDTDGIVHVIARNPESGKSEEIRIEATARMDETEVMRLAGEQ
jgi:molecular chaperone DnaK